MNPINTYNTLYTSLAQGNPQDIGQGNISNQWTQGPSMSLPLPNLMIPSSSFPMVPFTMKNQMGPQNYIPPPQSTILQGMLNQGNSQPLITISKPIQNISTHNPF